MNFIINLVCLLLFFSFNISSIHIYVIGDSHTRSIVGTGERSDNYVFHVHHLGAVTMHRVGRDGLKFLDFSLFSKDPQAVFACVFGEIDVRCHILKQRELGRNLDEVINSLVNAYFETLLENIKINPSCTCIVVSVVPPTNATHNPDYSIYGSLVERVEITKMINEKLKQKCMENKILYIDQYTDFCAQNGTLEYGLSDFSVHINQCFSTKLQDKIISLIESN